MSCHTKELEDGAILTICLPPIIGFVTVEEWIKRDRNLYGKNRQYKMVEKPVHKKRGRPLLRQKDKLENIL